MYYQRFAKPKYGNKKIETEDGKFDSKKEYKRWEELKLLARAGEITDLQRQQEFELIPKQEIDGKCVERKCSYIADFTYHDKKGNFVVEDTKGVRTPEYIIKRKMMLKKYGIRIREI